MLYHLSDYCPSNSTIAETIKTVLRGGWCGVDLFFVLSGFLITGILIDTQTAKNYFQAFYLRRMLRIFPVYYAVLVFVLVTARFVPSLADVLPQPHDRAFYFVYLNNWWFLMKGAWGANIIGHFWSLAIEEQFYLLWPVVLWCSPRKRVEVVAMCGILLALVIRISLFAKWGGIRDIVENPFCRMDSLLMGALLASFVRRESTGKNVPRVLYACAVAVGLAIVSGNYSNLVILKVAKSRLFIFSGLALVFGGLVLHTFLQRRKNSPTQRAFRSAALTRCGRYSYGMYIYHVPLLWMFAKCAPALKPTESLPRFLIFSVGVTALTLTVSKLSFDLFESRFLRWKQLFAARV